MLVRSLYAVAVQSKTHKKAFAIIFFICRDLLNCLWNIVLIILSLSNLTYKTVNYSSNSMKINLRLLLWKRLMQGRSCNPQNFSLILKFRQIRPVFPDYLSVSHDYGYNDTRAIYVASSESCQPNRDLFRIATKLKESVFKTNNQIPHLFQVSYQMFIVMTQNIIRCNLNAGVFRTRSSI